MRLKYLLLSATFCLLLSFFHISILNAQNKMGNYSSEWKKVEDLQKKGLTKSALAQVNTIYLSAKRSGNDPQIIKSLLFKILFNQNLVEDANEKSIDSFQLEIAKAKEPAKSILQSITAQLYWNYFQQNRYKLYQRTNTVNFDKKDIVTWTAADIHKKIGELYESSIKNESLLQNTKLEPFDEIISKGNSRNLRPTLYDLLAHRALDYFQSDERDISRPAYAFEINSSAVFASAPAFIKTKFITKDSGSLHQKAILIYQQLLAFHESDSDPKAFIDEDLGRLDFVNQYSVLRNKDKLYMEALINLAKKFNADPASAQASFLAAQLIYSKSDKNNIGKDSSISFSVAKAKDLLDEIVNKYPQSEGGINAQNLLTTILRPSLILTSEKVNVPGSPFRTLVQYQNFSSIWLRIIALTPELKKQLNKNRGSDIVFNQLKNQPAISTWQQALPKMNDFLVHSAEIKINALPIGEYALLASPREDFALDKNPLAAQYFYISNISFINTGSEYFVLDRTTGQPLQNANINVWSQRYDYTARENKVIKDESLISDKNGYFRLSDTAKDKNGRPVRLEIRYKNDRLFMEDYEYAYYNSYNKNLIEEFKDQKKSDDENAKVFLFTERSIYRPGQVVYFKGIGVTKDFKTKKSILLQTKDSLDIVFSDANGGKIDTMKVILNEFGSFNGKFKIPENKLNGEFEIGVSDFNNSSISFSVEEYKRPKFYTEFEKVKGSYRVNDTVKISGFAKAFAGN
ncbi:MAG: MG2 domain-containing protein, partial [Ginsengibacter sp.]